MGGKISPGYRRSHDRDVRNKYTFAKSKLKARNSDRGQLFQRGWVSSTRCRSMNFSHIVPPLQNLFEF